MNNKTLIAVIVGVLVIGAGLYFGLRKPEGSSNVAPDGSGSSMMEEKDAQKRMASMKAMMASGESVECEFSRTDAQGSMSGTVYFSGGKMRGNYMMASQGAGSYEMHMINDGEYAYTWGGPASPDGGQGGPMGATQGTKMKMSAVASGETTSEGKALDYDQQMEFDCDEWRGDTAQFNPPSDVAFTDLSVQLQQMQDATAPMKAAQCAACNQVPAESRAQCLEALGC